MAKILIVSEYTKASQNSTGYFWEKAIRQLITDGHEVRIIEQRNKAPHAIKQIALLRFVFKLIAAINLTIRTTIHLRRYQVVFSGTNPETLFLLLAILKKIAGFRWYVLVHDIFPENLVPAGLVSDQTNFYRLLAKIFQMAYKAPDKLFAIGRDMREVLKRKGVPPERIVYLPNWVNHEEIKPIEKSASTIIEKLGWNDRIVFQFFGNIGRVQGIRFLLDGIRLVKSPKAAFLFIGDGVHRQLVVNYIMTTDTHNVHYFGTLSDEMKESGLAACDVALVSLSKGMYGLGVPSKAYFSLAADRPLLAVMDKSSEIALMIEENAAGWVCSSTDPRELAATIDQICEYDLTLFKGKLRALLEEKYAERRILSQLSQAFFQ